MSLTRELSTFIENSLIIQVAMRNGLDAQDIFAGSAAGPLIDEDLSAEIVANLAEAGITAEDTAAHINFALRLIMMGEDTTEIMRKQIAVMLWHILGNPQETTTPPEIYNRASKQVWQLICNVI